MYNNKIKIIAPAEAARNCDLSALALYFNCDIIYSMNKNTHILAIETSSKIGSVALALGPQVIDQQAFTAELRHASELLPTIDRLCRRQSWTPADIQHLYVSAGPGSFTGIRIAITTAKTLAFALSIKLVAIPSLDVLAMNADSAARENNLDIKHLAAIRQAGRDRIFAAVFIREPNDQKAADHPPGLRTLIPQTMISPAELLDRSNRPLYLLGEGLDYHSDDFPCDGKQIIRLDPSYDTPSASNVLILGHLRAQAGLFTEPDDLMPIYLRRPEACEKWEKLHGKD